jgi:diaminopimelate decarboxylase
MSEYKTSFHNEAIEGVAKDFGTPFWLYDRSVIETRVRECQVFDVVRYAQKACSNLSILALMKTLGVVVDAVSAGEIVRALKVGYTGQGKVPGIVYTADIFDQDALDLVKAHHLPVNVGSPDMIRQLHDAGIKTELTIRVNPGFGHGHSRKTNTGGPLSKHGVWHENLAATLQMAQELGMPVSGLHMHIGSGADFEHLSQVCNAMVDVARPFGAYLKTISAGGGLPIPYRHENLERIDVHAYFQLWDDARKRIEGMVGHPISLEVEPGRYLVAESAVLVSEIRAVKKMGDNLFYLVDAGFTDLVRPSFYGSYHHISLIGRDGRPLEGEVDAIVAGPLCESGDVFTQEEGGFVVTRKLPQAEVGDLLVLHDVGAYGAAMSSNYNTRRYAAEVLWNHGKAELIRERQSFEHLLANDRILQF